MVCLLSRLLKHTPAWLLQYTATSSHPQDPSRAALWERTSGETTPGEQLSQELQRTDFWKFLCHPVSHSYTLFNKGWTEALGDMTLPWMWPRSSGCSLYLVFVYSLEFSLLLTSQSHYFDPKSQLIILGIKLSYSN